MNVNRCLYYIFLDMKVKLEVLIFLMRCHFRDHYRIYTGTIDYNPFKKTES